MMLAFSLELHKYEYIYVVHWSVSDRYTKYRFYINFIYM